MKRRILAALTMLPFMANAQSLKYTIKFKNEAAPASTVAHLIYDIDGKYFSDSAKMEKGIFTFNGTVPYPLRASLWANNNPFGYNDGHMPDLLFFYIDKGEIVINTKDSVKYAKVTGPKFSADFSKYNLFMNDVTSIIIQLNAQSVKMTTAKQDDAKSKADFDTRYKKAVDNYKERQITFIKNNPGSYASAVALNDFAGANVDLAVVEPLYKSISADALNTKAGKDLGKLIDAARNTSLGALAPNFTQNDTSGKPVSLTDFRGKYVLLDFWASWCGPCRAENPNYVKAYHQYKDKGFTMLGVSLDRPGAKNDWTSAIKADGLEWPQVCDFKYWYNDVAKLYNIRAVPQNFLIDPNGKIIARNLRGDDLEKKLAELFGK